MTLTTDQIRADLDRQFADFAVDVVHQLVSTSFSPRTLMNTESVQATTLKAVVAHQTSTTTTGTGGQFQNAELQITFRTADLPTLGAGQLRRVVYHGQVWEMIGEDHVTQGEVITFQCRKRIEASTEN